MSADCISVCPACYAGEFRMDINSISIDELSDERISNQMREEYDIYIDKGFVVVGFKAHCWECDYHIEFTHRHPLGGDEASLLVHRND